MDETQLTFDRRVERGRRVFRPGVREKNTRGKGKNIPAFRKRGGFPIQKAGRNPLFASQL